MCQSIVLVYSLVSLVVVPFLWCVWVSSVARSCATKDANNQDDSITVSSACELTSVSMRYSQGKELIPPCLGLLTVPTCQSIVLVCTW